LANSYSPTSYGTNSLYNNVDWVAVAYFTILLIASFALGFFIPSALLGLSAVNVLMLMTRYQSRYALAMRPVVGYDKETVGEQA